jgi:hypothetical protein
MSMNMLFSRGYSKSESTECALECCYSNTKSTQLLPEQQPTAPEDAD